MVDVVKTDLAPAHRGPVPQAVRQGGLVFVSALFGADPKTGVVARDRHTEASRLFSNLQAVLTAAGGVAEDVLSVTIYMLNLQGDRPAFNAAWSSYFGSHRPARCAVEVRDFGRPEMGARYMVTATAMVASQ